MLKLHDHHVEPSLLAKFNQQRRDRRFPSLILQPELKTGQGPLLPRLQAIQLDPDLTRHRVERLPAQQSQHDVPLAARAPPLPRRQGPRPACRGVLE